MLHWAYTVVAHRDVSFDLCMFQVALDNGSSVFPTRTLAPIGRHCTFPQIDQVLVESIRLPHFQSPKVQQHDHFAKRDL
jgi:hypothetical protein